MKLIRTMLVSAALVAGTTPYLLAEPQGDWRYQDHDRDRNQDRDSQANNQAFQEGYRQGQWDAQHNRRSGMNNGRRHGGDRQAYESGYNRGYQEAHNNGGYRNDGRYRNGNPGNWGGANSTMGSARQFGSQDGLNDGAQDRRTGHSFRPTEGNNYKSATRGYQSGFGSKDQYKQMYRQSYSEAYRQGYYGNGRGGR
jgi:hypothetical protein